MKQFSLTLLLAVFTVFGASAQTVDIIVTEIDPPADSAVYTIGDSINLSFTFFNVGPDSMNTGDTLNVLYQFDTDPIAGFVYLLQSPLSVNGGIQLTLNNKIALPSVPGPHTFCLSVFPRVFTEADSSDNILCNDFDLIDPVSVTEVSAATINAFYADGALNVTLPGNQRTELQVIDITGRQVANHTLFNTNELVNVSDLPQGIYIATFTGQNGDTFSKKFMVN